MATWLVTGTAGFIGSHVALKLLARGDEVIGIDNLNDYYDVDLKQPRLARFADHPRLYGPSCVSLDYHTPDGTGVRDYLHVMDLAEAHLKAVDYAAAHTGCEVIKLGTGRGYSVLEVVHAFEAASGKPVPSDIQPRRNGDVTALTANPARAQDLLQWRVQHGMDAMCGDAWRCQARKSTGFIQ